MLAGDHRDVMSPRGLAGGRIREVRKTCRSSQDKPRPFQKAKPASTVGDLPGGVWSLPFSHKWTDLS